MRYYISQAMNGRTDAEIKEERHKVIAAMKKENPEAKVIDSFFEGAPNEAKPLWFLGKSFELLSTADMCVFVDYAADTARGCALEYRACLAYGIDCCKFDTEMGAFVATTRGG